MFGRIIGMKNGLIFMPPPLDQRSRVVLRRRKPSVAVAHDDADAVIVLLRQVDACVFDGHSRRCDRKLGEAGHTPRLSPIEVLQRVEVGHLAGEVTGKV